MRNIKQQLIETSFECGNFDHRKHRARSNIELRKTIKDLTSFLPEEVSSAQRAWHIFHELDSYPLCSGGNERRSFHTFKDGYVKTCYLPRFQCSCWEDARKSSRLTMKKTNESGKIKESFYKKYGVYSSSKIPGIGDKISNSRENILFGKMRTANLNIEKLKKLKSSHWWEDHSNLSCNEISVLLDINNTTIKYFYTKYSNICSLINKRMTKPEIKIKLFLDKHNIKYKQNDRKTIYPLELDFHLIEHQLAIEVNGLYWHSELNGKDKHYHLQKTLECEKKGIRLLQFWDFEVEDKWPIIESMLATILKLNTITKLSARKCVVKDIEHKEACDFLTSNHIQGYRQGTIKRGLFFNDELVCVLIASKPRYNTKYDLEIIRFCSKQYTVVRGGFSKLLKTLQNKTLISYASINYSTGKSYFSCGWTYLYSSSPSYYYTDDYQTLYHRSSFQKHKLPQLLEIFNPSLTEWDNMVINGFDRVWDCGQHVFVRGSV